jgi:hypothetical protein
VEYGLSHTTTFKDGSKLTVCAWWMEPVHEDYDDEPTGHNFH